MPTKDIHKIRYKNQKNGAKWRGIEWHLTFDEWMQWWLESGHYHERGPSKGQYVMARIGDCGPYALGNIMCIPNNQNNVLAFPDRGEITHCIRGHSLAGTNLKMRSDGSRECRLCTRMRKLQYRRRRRVSQTQV